MKTRHYYVEKSIVEGADMYDVHVISEGDDLVVESFQDEGNALKYVAEQMRAELNG